MRTGKARSNIRHFLKTMQYEESAGLGERLLDQALRALKGSLAEVEEPAWERVVRDSGARSREELLADIGLGKRLPAVVARRLTKTVDVKTRKRRAASRSAAPRAWRYSSPPAAGRFRAMRSSARSRRAKGWWCTPGLRRQPALAQERAGAVDRRGVGSAHHAPVPGGDQRHGGEPARRAGGGFRDRRRGSNIDSIAMGDDRPCTAMHFVLEVRNRQHLARVMRALRRLPDVQKISRTRE